MMTASLSPDLRIVRRILLLQILTILWMTAEALVSLFAAWRARSPALLGFGGDSAIELFSAAIVYWRFRTKSCPALSERFAARAAGVLLIALALYVAVVSLIALFGHRESRSSLLGIALLLLAALVMPWFAYEKRKLARHTSSAALQADAVESAVCGYLACVALAGLLVNALWHQSWADPLAALLLLPFILREAYQALRSAKLPCDCL